PGAEERTWEGGHASRSRSLRLAESEAAVVRRCRRMTPLSTADELDRLHVVLVDVRNPLNIGAAARAMSNFGVLHLRVVNPYHVAFREARSAVGAPALLRAANEYASVADAVAGLSLVVGTTAVGQGTLQ